jgi:hypothetical protein
MSTVWVKNIYTLQKNTEAVLDHNAKVHEQETK